MRVALVTWELLPRLSDDDRRLLPALRRLGVSVVPAVWSEPSVEWSTFGAVVVRSTWDYYRRYPEFLSWVAGCGAEGRLWNPAEVIRWNSHKSYLLDLDRRGVPVVPTRICHGVSDALAVLRKEGWSRSVVKAAVSAGGYRTYLVTPEMLERQADPWGEAAPVGEVLVQPYVEEVERSGERSLVFFRGEYSHAFLRAPRLAVGSDLVEEAPVTAVADEVALGLRALACAPEPTLYGRVDMVRDGEGRMRVMELELIEPALGLRTSASAAAVFARAISAVAQPDQARAQGA